MYRFVSNTSYIIYLQSFLKTENYSCVRYKNLHVKK